MCFSIFVAQSLTFAAEKSCDRRGENKKPFNHRHRGTLAGRGRERGL